VIVQKPLVFISHISEEAEIAHAFQTLLQRSFLGMVETFVSSDPSSIEVGQRWLDRITASLKACVLEVVVASHQSIVRPWINFEAGAGWVRDIQVVPLCHSGMTHSLLPSPLRELQAVVATDHLQVQDLLNAIARKIHSDRPTIDLGAFVSAVRGYEATSTKLAEIDRAHSEPRKSGLLPHEVETLIEIANRTSIPGEPVEASYVTQSLTDAGYPQCAVVLAFAALSRRSLISASEDSGYTVTFHGVTVTSDGWDWLQTNAHALGILKKTPPKKRRSAPVPPPSDDIPF